MLFAWTVWSCFFVIVYSDPSTTFIYNSTFLSTSLMPTVLPSNNPTSYPSEPSIMPSMIPTQTPPDTFYPTQDPTMGDGRDGSQTTNTHTPTQDDDIDSDDDDVNCDMDHGCKNSTNPTNSPSMQPIQSSEPTQSPTDLSIPTSSPTEATIEPTKQPIQVPTEAKQSESDSSTSWNDPIVVAVGLLGFLVLLLTCMVTIFACMAYTKSKENMKITERLKAQFMADNSHSKDSEYQQGQQRGKKFQTDYRDIQSTDAALSVSYDDNMNNNDNNSRGRNDTVPGSMKKQNDVLEMEDLAAEVVIEMAKDSQYSTNQGLKAGESDIRLSVAQNNNNIDNNNLPNPYAGAPGRISTAEVIASIEDEGADIQERPEIPQMQLISSSVSEPQGFAAGLNNVAAADNALEDDIIAHMATAGGGNDDDQKDDNGPGRGNADSIQLQYG